MTLAVSVLLAMFLASIVIGFTGTIGERRQRHTATMLKELRRRRSKAGTGPFGMTREQTTRARRSAQWWVDEPSVAATEELDDIDRDDISNNGWIS